MNDKSLMPFGKHKGTRLIEVPASHLLWCGLQEFVAEKHPELMNYVNENLDSLLLEKKEEDRYSFENEFLIPNKYQ